MTVSPQAPCLAPSSSSDNHRVLTEDHLTFIKGSLGFSVMVLIKKGYETDGASVPTSLTEDDTYGKKIKEIIQAEFPKITTRFDFESLLKKLIGTPWDMPRLLAAIVHDALYDIHWCIRLMCDKIYKKILLANGYDPVRARIEYSCIRLVGWRNWNAITDLQRARAKKLVKVEIVRTRNISKIIEELKQAA